MSTKQSFSDAGKKWTLNISHFRLFDLFAVLVVDLRRLDPPYKESTRIASLTAATYDEYREDSSIQTFPRPVYKARFMWMTHRVLHRYFLFATLFAIVGCEPNVPVGNSTTRTSSSGARAPGATGAKRLILLTNGDSPYWDACREGLNAANRDLKLADAGLKAVMDVNDGTAQGQLSKLQQYGTQSDIAGVGVSAIDAKNIAIADELRSMQKKGIKIITIDSDVDRTLFADARFAFVGTDNLAAGKVLGKCAAVLKPEGGEYVTFFGIEGAQNVIERTAGFAEGAGEKFVEKDKMADETDRPKARENVRNAMRNHPNLGVLVGIWSYNAPAIVDVVKEAKRRKDFKIVVFDAEPSAITAMAEGNIDVMVVQNPFAMGYEGIHLLHSLVLEKTDVQAVMLPMFGRPGGDIFDTGLKVVVPDGTSLSLPEELSKRAEITTLNKFKDWLKKYGLTGS